MGHGTGVQINRNYISFLSRASFFHFHTTKESAKGSYKTGKSWVFTLRWKQKLNATNSKSKPSTWCVFYDNIPNHHYQHLSVKVTILPHVINLSCVSRIIIAILQSQFSTITSDHDSVFIFGTGVEATLGDNPLAEQTKWTTTVLNV